MSALTLLSVIAPAVPNAPQAASDEAASGFQALLAGLIGASGPADATVPRAIETPTPVDAPAGPEPDTGADTGIIVDAAVPPPAPSRPPAPPPVEARTPATPTAPVVDPNAGPGAVAPAPAPTVAAGEPGDGEATTPLPAEKRPAPKSDEPQVLPFVAGGPGLLPRLTGAPTASRAGFQTAAMVRTPDASVGSPLAQAPAPAPALTPAPAPAPAPPLSWPPAPAPAPAPAQPQSRAPAAAAAPAPAVAVAPAPAEASAPAPGAASVPAPAPAPAQAPAPAVTQGLVAAPAPAPLRPLAERTARAVEPPLSRDGEAARAVDVARPAFATAGPAPTLRSDEPSARPADLVKAAPVSDAGGNEGAEPAPESLAQTETPAAQTQAAAGARDGVVSQLSRATVEATAQIAAQILRRLEGRSTRFEMALTPDELGRVDVKLDIDSEGRLNARLAFDSPVAATDLKGRADELRRQLEDAGFHLADDALEFADRDSGSSAFDRGQDARSGSSRAFAAASRLNAETDVAQPPRWLTLSLSPSGVDMKV